MGDKKDVTQFFLVFMRVFGLLGTKSGKRFYRRCPTSKPQLNPPQRGFRLIFQAGSPAFLRVPTFFPVVGSAEVSGSFIDRLTNPQKRANSKPSRSKGVVRPFLERPGWLTGALSCNDSSGRRFVPPSPRPSPPDYLPAGKEQEIPLRKFTPKL